jgi:hypothetical protein
MQTSTLRPGLLVSLNTTISGNVTYKRREIEADHITDQGTKEASWQTDRTIFDPVEDEKARIVRSKARSLVTAVCARSAFGLLCPESKAANLDAAISDARKLADEFNATANLSRVGVYVITGRIAQDDVEAVRAINSEVRELMAAMAAGIGNLDVEQVREAANKARNISSMLTPEAQDRIAIAIKTARDAARKIVQAGEQAAQEIDLVAMRKIEEARTAFLDLDETPTDVAAPELEQRALDLDPTVKAASDAYVANAKATEFIDDEGNVQPFVPPTATPMFEF